MLLQGSLATLVFYAVAGAVLFGAAGRWDVPSFWAWLAFMLVSSLAILPILARTSPGLIEERMRPGPGNRDRWGTGVGAAWLLLMLGVAGADVGRFHWSAPITRPLSALAWAGVVAGFWLVAWAMSVNRYFSSAVRIQSDRGQVVVSAGPYARMRHPGYTGGLSFLIFTGPVLGSWWVVLLTLPAVAWILHRTGLEDAMLRSELEGYDDYAGRVRFRLVPGVW